MQRDMLVYGVIIAVTPDCSHLTFAMTNVQVMEHCRSQAVYTWRTTMSDLKKILCINTRIHPWSNNQIKTDLPTIASVRNFNSRTNRISLEAMFLHSIHQPIYVRGTLAALSRQAHKCQRGALKYSRKVVRVELLVLLIYGLVLQPSDDKCPQ
jgi:hypothetical protein